MNYGEKSLKLHKKIKGKLEMNSKVKLNNKEDLSIAYTPGIAEVSKEIYKDNEKARELTIKNNFVAVVSNGTAVLGLGDIGALASLPVMEGKSAIMKELAGVNSIPLVIEEKDPYKLIEIIKKVSIQFAAINLEDIKAPDCFIVERELQNIGIPVFHDDQHGTAIVTLAALINSLILTERIKDYGEIQNKEKLKDIKVVINGAGAAANAIFWILKNIGFDNIIVLDSKGSLSLERARIEDKNNKYYLNKFKKEIANEIKNEYTLNLKNSLKDADVFIGVSKGNILKAEDLLVMKDNAIIISLANPVPEIIPEEILKIMKKENKKVYLEELKKVNTNYYKKLRNIDNIDEKISIYCTGRSDLPNQVNNALVFPSLFKGLIKAQAKKIKRELFSYLALELAKYNKEKTVAKILPELLDKELHNYLADKVYLFYKNNQL